jgi:CheY-like chemotaxis protein
MNKSGPIIIIEDDPDDQEIFEDIFKELANTNEVLYFFDGIQALDYLTNSAEQPFLILSDINLPKLNGIDLREKIHNNEQLRLKCIPYLFFTTTANHRDVVSAYAQSVQGFFTKPDSYRGILRVMRNILEYWKDCHAPNLHHNPDPGSGK